MKRQRARIPFILQLRQALSSLKDMKPGEVHVFNINANYGHYQIIIGRGAASDPQARPIEINGEIHHLFVTPREVRVHPGRQQVMENLRDTVIMRDLSVHLHDPTGEGSEIEPSDDGSGALQARECINMAGSVGEMILEKMRRDTRLSMAAYRIIQRDILMKLRQRSESTEE